MGNGTVMQVDNMERPYVYIEEGEVKMIDSADKVLPKYKEFMEGTTNVK